MRQQICTHPLFLSDRETFPILIAALACIKIENDHPMPFKSHFLLCSRKCSNALLLKRFNCVVIKILMFLHLADQYSAVNLTTMVMALVIEIIDVLGNRWIQFECFLSSISDVTQKSDAVLFSCI